MPDWPAPTRVDDRRFAHALREGDAGDVAHVYSGYAAPLFDYCHALLRDQDDAIAALHDTFVAAHAHVARLTEPEHFRAWLYALARNEALLRLNDPARPVERQEAPEVENSFEDAAEREHRLEGRALMHSALSALSGRQRETIDLLLRHRLEVQDLAGVLGVSADEAAELAAEARTKLDGALAAALIARSDHSGCPSVTALVDGAGWPLTAALSRKLVRHIEHCPACAEQSRRKVSAARLAETLPVALLPSDLQRSVLTTLTAPELAEQRAEIADGAEPLDSWGWPVPKGKNKPAAGAGRGGDRSWLSAKWPLLAAAALMLVLVGSVLFWLPGSSGPSSAQSPTTPGSAPLDPTGTPEVEPSDSLGPSPDPSESPSLTPTPTPTPSASATPSPSQTPSKSPSPPKTPVKPGKLAVASNGCEGVNVTSGQSATCTITVKAVDGPVANWSVTKIGEIDAVSGGGRLAAGQIGAATVTVSATCTAEDSNKGHAGGVVFTPGGVGSAVTWTCVPEEPAAAEPSAGTGDPGDPSPAGTAL